MSQGKDIAFALLVRLAAFTGIQASRVQFPGKTFTPPADGIWIETTFHALEPRNVEIGLTAPARREGWLQMTVVTHRGDGIVGVLDMAEDLSAHFPLGAQYTSNGLKVRVTKTPGPESPFEDDGMIRCPVKVRYQAYA